MRLLIDAIKHTVFANIEETTREGAHVSSLFGRKS